MVDLEVMKAYSEDLRQKVVEAVEQRGTSKSEAARLFGISLSSVKRYARLARRGSPLPPGRAEADRLRRTKPPRGYSKKTSTSVLRPPSVTDAASCIAPRARA
jgi:transposase-like protein